MEINNELRERIFSAYWGCGVHHPCDNSAFKYRGLSENSEPILYGDWSGGTNPEYSATSSCSWQDIKLMLNGLSKLTDEHSLECCRILGINEGAISMGKYAHFCKSLFTMEKLGRELVMYVYGYGHGRMPAINFTKVSELTDYLRKEGYDVGYGNIQSLISAGIAIPKI